MIADAEPLSIHADSVSASASTRGKTAPATEGVSDSIKAHNRYVDRRRSRYRLRSGIQTVTKEKRLRACGCWPQARGEGVDLHLSDDGAAYYAGLQSCASPWICPVCAAKIRQRHADDIAAAALQWLSEGQSLYSMMLTLPHDRGMPLGELWEFIAGSFRNLLTGRYWKRVKQRFGLEGFVRSTEVTYGANGWHPHLHVLFFFDDDVESGALSSFADVIFRKWSGFVTGAGYREPRRDLFNLSPVRNASAVCDYLVKTGHFEDNPDFAVVDSSPNTRKQSGISSNINYVRLQGEPVEKRGPVNNSYRRIGLEIARSDLKEGRRAGRTPFQIIADYLSAPVERAADLARWHEWESESKGKRSIGWSRDTIYLPDGSYTFRSFKRRFDLEEKTDEELATDDVGGARLASLSPVEWTVVRSSERILRLLEVAESHGAGGVSFYVDYLIHEFAKTGDLSGLDELDEMIDASASIRAPDG